MRNEPRLIYRHLLYFFLIRNLSQFPSFCEFRRSNSNLIWKRRKFPIVVQLCCKLSDEISWTLSMKAVRNFPRELFSKHAGLHFMNSFTTTQCSNPTSDCICDCLMIGKHPRTLFQRRNSWPNSRRLENNRLQEAIYSTAASPRVIYDPQSQRLSSLWPRHECEE